MKLIQSCLLIILSVILSSCNTGDSGNKGTPSVIALEFPQKAHMASNCIILNGTYDYFGTTQIKTQYNGTSVIYNHYSLDGKSIGMMEYSGTPIHYSNFPPNESELNGCYETNTNTKITFDNTTNKVLSRCIQTLDSSLNIVMNCTGCNNGQCGSQQMIFKKIQ